MNAAFISNLWPRCLLWSSILAIVLWWVLRPTVFGQLAPGNSAEWPKTNFDNKIVEFSEIMSGGPPKDGIPAVDDPKFVRHGDASGWLDDREPVIVVQIGKQARAYPLQILMYHEIVNDTLGGVPISVTFCPLCNASIVFDRRVDGEVLDFGTTGRLRKSDLVMYDRQTETWWQQFTGRGIIGDYAGTVLQMVSARIVAYEDFRSAYPASDVLSRDTGFHRPYGNNPYRGYDRIGQQPFLFRDPVDSRLPAMERVINVSVDGLHRLYPFSVFKTEPVINDTINTVPMVVFSRDGTLSVLDDGTIADSRSIPSAAAYDRRHGDDVLTFDAEDGRVFDLETGSEWDMFGRAVDGELKGESLDAMDDGVHFAFAWLAFNPDSEVYSGR